MSNENGNWADYDSFIQEAEKDTRVGDHDFMVSEVAEDTWPSGDPRIKVHGVLLTANQAKCDFTWSPPPPASVLREMAGTMEPGKKKAIASAITLAKKLGEGYGKKVADLKAGDVIRVKTVKTKVDATTGKGGFIRIVAVLPKEQIGQASKEVAASADSVQF